jgi:hypothetical protein
MPSLVAKVGKVELFIHDSLHTCKNTLFEMEQAASVMPPGGVMLIDDIRSHAHGSGSVAPGAASPGGTTAAAGGPPPHSAVAACR